jgi:hypothetical protein
MPTNQGDVGLLREPLAQQLLQAPVVAHLAYTWRDGTPRVVPIGFHWNGTELVLATATDAPKTKVLRTGARVAVSIESDALAQKVLQIRGTVRTDTLDGITPEFVAMNKRTLGEAAGQANVDRSARLYPPMTRLYPRMTRHFIHPEWVGLLDFETRLPSAVERAIERVQANAR